MEHPGDLKHLISQRKQRPSYTRLISWEFSNTTEYSRTQRHNKKKQGPLHQESEDDEDLKDADLFPDGQEDSHPSSLGSFEGSSDDSEYYSAFEDELELSMSSSRSESLSESFSAGDSSLGASSRSVPSMEMHDAENVEEVFKNPDSTGELQPGRRRRPSKKQKKKRGQKYKIAFTNDFLCIGNVFDMEDDIESTCAMVDENLSLSQAERPVPSLTDICLRAFSKSKKPVVEVGQMPPGVKHVMKDWNRSQSFTARQLSWLQNSLLPLCNSELYFENICLASDKSCFIFPSRSVWDVIPVYRDVGWNSGEDQYTASKTCSFLLCCSMQKINRELHWRYQDYIDQESIRPLVVLSAVATTIDLMLPPSVRERVWDRKSSSPHQVLLDKATQSMVYRIKHALRTRFPRLVDELFDFAVPYVMWARGSTSLATQLFKELTQREKRARQRAMFLSEIARMYAHFEQRDLAGNFYRLASEVCTEKSKHHVEIGREVTEQTQILLAGLFDQGVFSEANAREATVAWNCALNLPTPRLETVIAGLESFLCYQAGHWTDSPWLEEAKTRIERLIGKHEYLKYYLSLVYALMGRENDCTSMYRQFTFSGLQKIPGRQFQMMLDRRARCSPWQPLLDIVKQQNSSLPIMPLKVVWRAQLQPGRIGKESVTVEADMRSDEINLRLNDEGLLTGDMQLMLPPMRGISLDPYTGHHVISYTPSLTQTWKGMLDQQEAYNSRFIPNLQEVYSDEAGTRLHLLYPNTQACANYTNAYENEVVCPVWLYYENGEGERAKRNVLAMLKDEARKNVVNEIQSKTCGKNFPESKKQGMLDLVGICYRKNLPLEYYKIESLLRRKLDLEKQAKKRARKGIQEKARKKDDYLMKGTAVAKLNQPPMIYGKTVFLDIVYSNTSFKLVVNCKSRETFLQMKFRGKRGSEMVEPCQFGVSSNQYGLFYRNGNEAIVVRDQNGDVVKDLICKRGVSYHTCILGPVIFTVSDKNFSLMKWLVDDDVEEKPLEEEPDEEFPLLPFVQGVVAAGQTPTVKGMKVTANTLLFHFCHGICFLDPVSGTPIPITLIGTLSLKLTPDQTIIQGEFSTVKILEEKLYSENGRTVTRIALALDYHLLIVELDSSQTRGSGKSVVLKAAVDLPGNLTEVCFVGKEVGFLVSVTQQDKESDYYREQVFYFDFHGNLCGVLPFLGPGQRSFFPVYLHGDANKDSAQSIAGWYVYLRDGHNGIIALRLSGNLHVHCAVP